MGCSRRRANQVMRRPFITHGKGFAKRAWDAGPDRHVRLALPPLARPLFPRWAAEEAAPCVLPPLLRDGGAERRLLPHAGAGGGARLGRADASRVRVRVEGVAVP